MKVRSMRGVEIDIGAFISKNENMIAVGGANMNARGDIIGRGGVVVKSRSEIAQDYHRSNPKAVRQVGIKDLEDNRRGSDRFDVDFADPQSAVAAVVEKNRKPRKIEDTDD